jgi:hypothetical protein
MEFFGVIWICSIILAGVITKKKGRGGLLGVLLGVLLSVIGLVIALVLSDEARASTYRECPHCKEQMRRDAGTCPHCHSTSVAWQHHDNHWWKHVDGGWQWLDEKTQQWNSQAPGTG